MKTRCVTTAPFNEAGIDYKIGDEVELEEHEIVRLGGAGLVKKLEETWKGLPEDCSVTVVVLLYRTEYAELKKWVDTILESTENAKARLDVVVVENTGAPYPDKTRNASYVKDRGFDYVRTEKNLGFAGGCNLGASYAKGDVIVFLNDDMEFAEPWLDTLIEPLRTDNKVAVAGADLQKENGDDWRAYDRPDWVCGACFAVRRFDFQRFGGFDDGYFFSWEETDYCQLVTKLGYRVAKTPAKVIHRGGETSDIKSDFAVRCFEDGRARFAAKWTSGRRLVTTMIVGNEKGRYLPESLVWALARCEKVVIVDDASTDGTKEVLEMFANYYPDKISLYRNETSQFKKDEHIARESLHHKALKEAATHIIPLDADEELSQRYDTAKDELLSTTDAWDFPIVHLWSDREHYRVDNMWGQQSNVRLYAVKWERFQDFYCQPLHCGSAPIYAYECKVKRDDVALIHKGWIRREDFERKKKRNTEIDPSGYWEPQGHWYSDPVISPFKDDGNPNNNFSQHTL